MMETKPAAARTVALDLGNTAPGGRPSHTLCPPLRLKQFTRSFIVPLLTLHTMFEQGFSIPPSAMGSP